MYQVITSTKRDGITGVSKDLATKAEAFDLGRKIAIANPRYVRVEIEETLDDGTRVHIAEVF